MSKYEEYRAIAEKMETLYGTSIGKTGREVRIRFNPVTNDLDIEIERYVKIHKFNVWGDEGKALYTALKQIYE
jgi:hypothetical protein